MHQSISDYLTLIHTQKSQLDALRPFNQSQLKNLQEWFRIGFIHHSNAIEGNTLSLQEVKLVIEEGITIGGKTVRELQETINHGKVMDLLHDCFEKNGVALDAPHVLELHRVLMQGILPTQECGQRRMTQIRVSGSDDVFPLPQHPPELMDVFFHQTAHQIRTIEQVAQVHYEFVKIHPFVDGNGRIARVLMNLGLIELGYFPIIIPKVVRAEYIASLQGDSFETRYQFFLRQVSENHKDYLTFFKNS